MTTFAYALHIRCAIGQAHSNVRQAVLKGANGLDNCWSPHLRETGDGEVTNENLDAGAWLVVGACHTQILRLRSMAVNT